MNISRFHACLVAALLTGYLIMALTAAERFGPAFDEIGHITSGYNVWLRHDFRLDPANGDLPKRWATLPLLWSRPRFPAPADPAWRAGDPQTTGFQFFFRLQNSPESLLAQCRCMIALLGVALAALVYHCSRQIFGPDGGLLSLALCCFSPNLLAHGALVTADLAVTLLLFAATWHIWRLLQFVSWQRVATSIALVGLLILAKLSGLVIIPIAAVLTMIRLLAGRPWRFHFRGCDGLVARRFQIALVAGLIMVHALGAWTLIWAAYDFRYAAAVSDDPGLRLQSGPVRLETLAPRLARVTGMLERRRVFPAAFLHGVEQMAASSQSRLAFMDGKWRVGGWPTYFLHTLVAKTPLGLFLLLTLALARRAVTRSRQVDGYAIVPYGVLIAVYLAVASLQKLQIGHRHILPIYPAIFVLAGGLVARSARFAWPSWAAVGCALWFVADSLSVRPHYLSYYNGAVGGPQQAYRHFVDSSTDWGMNLPEVKTWLEANNAPDPAPVFLGYFGTDDPTRYGLNCFRLPGFFDWRPPAVFPLQAGYYVISATLLESIYTPTPGPWNRSYESRYQQTMEELRQWFHGHGGAGAAAQAARLASMRERQLHDLDLLRFGRLCAWLRNKRSPDAVIGDAVLVWKLTESDLAEALLGPPVELNEDPPPTSRPDRMASLP